MSVPRKKRGLNIRSWLPALLILVLMTGSASLLVSRDLQAADSMPDAEETVATVLPVAHLLSRTLLADTGVGVDYLPARRYPVGRIGYWIDKKLPAALPDLPIYRSVVEIASRWPQGAVYPALRQRHIGIIPVDLAQQIKPDGARVSRSAGEQPLDLFWLNTANLKVMLTILAEDLSRIWPQHQATIQRNQQEALAAITGFALQLDETLWQQAWEGVCSEDSALQPMLQSLSLPQLRPEENNGDLSARCLEIEEGRKPAAEAGIWTLNGLNRYYPGTLTEWLQQNLAALQDAA